MRWWKCWPTRRRGNFVGPHIEGAAPHEGARRGRVTFAPTSARLSPRRSQMSELAVKRMTVAEFLRWEDGTDTRYELLGGSPVAMAPPAIAHGILALRLGARIDAALRSRPPCFGQSEAGIVRPDRDDTCYVADLAVSCSPPERGQQLLQDPLLIVEILSPGTAMYDRQTKVADYRRD